MMKLIASLELHSDRLVGSTSGAGATLISFWCETAAQQVQAPGMQAEGSARSARSCAVPESAARSRAVALRVGCAVLSRILSGGSAHPWTALVQRRSNMLHVT